MLLTKTQKTPLFCPRPLVFGYALVSDSKQSASWKRTGESSTSMLSLWALGNDCMVFVKHIVSQPVELLNLCRRQGSRH